MGAVSVQVRDTDRGAKKLMARIKRAGRKVVKVGIQGDDGSEPKEGAEELTLVQVASFHEFGEGDNPERSFIRATVDDQEKEIRALQKRIGVGILKLTMTEERGLGLIGIFMKAEIQKRIQAGIDPELSDATIARKGSTTPLIDTGQLVQSITWNLGAL